MTAELITFLLIGAAAGGFVNGLAGFGTSLFALGWWLHILPPVQAVAIVLVLSVASGIQGVVLVRKSIQWKRLAIFLIPGLIGIPLGLVLLQRIDVEILKLLIGGFLLLYAAFFIARQDLPRLTPPAWADACVGGVGGVLGALAGLSGALPTMWLTLRAWQKAEMRAVLQPYNVAILGISALMLAATGVYTTGTLVLIAVALPTTMAAAQAGLWAFGRLTDIQFRRLLIVLMGVSGAVLLARSLL